VGPLTRKPFSYLHVEPVSLEGVEACRFHETLGMLLVRVCMRPGANALERLDALMDMRGNPAWVDPVIGRSALHMAATASNALALLRVLVPSPTADLNVREMQNGDTPMHVLARNTRCGALAPVVRFMVMRGGSPTGYQNDRGETPLTTAILCRSHHFDRDDLASLMSTSEARAHVNTAAGMRLTKEGHLSQHMLPLMCATERGALGVVDQLLTVYGATTEAGAAGVGGRTALMIAVIGGYTSIVTRLIDAKADVLRTDTRGYTALHYAALFDRAGSAAALLSASGDAAVVAQQVMATDHQADGLGQTPLHIAIQAGSARMARVLLTRHAAAYHAVDRNGRSPLAVAERIGNALMLRLLRQHSNKRPKEEGGHKKKKRARLLAEEDLDKTDDDDDAAAAAGDK
jgi:ankyrin repeat protein